MRLIAVLACLLLSGCAWLAPRDPVEVEVVDLTPLPGGDLEARFQLTLRVVNPNEQPIDYHGVAVRLRINGQPLASGVSDQQGVIPAYGEGRLALPVSITAFSVMRQAWALTLPGAGTDVSYAVSGKLGAGPFGATRFDASGTLLWPQVP